MRLFKRNESPIWWYEFYHENQQVRRSSKTTNKKVATDIATAFRHNLLLGKVGLAKKEEKPVPCFEDAMADFLAWSEATHGKPNTTRRLKISSKPLLRHFAGQRLDEIEKRDVERYKEIRVTQKRRTRTGKSTGKTVMGSTVNRELACLKEMYNYHIGLGVDVENPVKNVKYFAESEEFHVVTKEEQELYLAAASQPLIDVAIIMLETGMRPDEVYTMRVDKVNLQGNFYFVYDGKTKAARRRIHFTKRVREIIEKRMDNGEWLFPGKDPSRPLTKLNNGHYATLRRAKLPHFRIYDFRHSFASRCVEIGVDLVTLAALLGHAKISMVLKYSHPSEDHKKAAIARLSGA